MIDPDEAVEVFVNATTWPTSGTDGLTVTAAGRLSPRVEMYGGYAEFDARITRPTTAAPAGNRPGLVPRRQGSLWLAHDVSAQLRIAGGS